MNEAVDFVAGSKPRCPVCAKELAFISGAEGMVVFACRQSRCCVEDVHVYVDEDVYHEFGVLI